MLVLIVDAYPTENAQHQPIDGGKLKGSIVSKSLSIILPVCNAESKLVEKVQRLLEVAADLTGKLELMIVDDGSTDSTEEVAMELSQQYPQVSTIRFSQSCGKINAVKAGIERTRGDVLLIQNLDAPVSAEAVRELWNMRQEEELVFSRSEAAHSGPKPVMHCRPTWSGGTQMIRRETVNEQQPAPHNPTPAKKSDRVTRTESSSNPVAPAMFQQMPNLEMQPDR